MRISRNLLAPLSLMVGLVTVIVPVRAHGNIIGVVDEGKQLTINGFTITNNNAFQVTLAGLTEIVFIPNFAGVDAGDFVTTVSDVGGTCAVGLVLAAGGACTVDLLFTTPPADVGEPVDFGVSQIRFASTFNQGPSSALLFEIQVNDAPVPEPKSATLVSLGIAVLLGASYVAKKREFNPRALFS
jgi:hypothetical protein